MSTRKWFRVDVIIFICFLATAGWGISVWFKKHQQEAKQEAASRAETQAKTIRAKSALARLKTAWNADDSWEHKIQSASYSLEIEHALVTGSPIIVIGTIQDIKTVGDQGQFVVLIDDDDFSSAEINLTFSLMTTPDVANAILADTHNDSIAESSTFLATATIERVEKVEQPPDKEGNDQDYFLAHGKLLGYYDTQMFYLNRKDLGEN